MEKTRGEVECDVNDNDGGGRASAAVYSRLEEARKGGSINISVGVEACSLEYTLDAELIVTHIFIFLARFKARSLPRDSLHLVVL